MNDLRTAAQQALEAMETVELDIEWRAASPTHKMLSKAITALRAALAQQAKSPCACWPGRLCSRQAQCAADVRAQEQAEPVEPVGEVLHDWSTEKECIDGTWACLNDLGKNLPVGTKLYTAPPQRKPLPKHDQHCVDVPGYGLMAVRLVRAVERAHGIKE